MQATGRLGPQNGGRLVWLVSLPPAGRTIALGGVPLPDGCSEPTRPAPNWFVVLIDANSGAVVVSESGYSPLLGPSAPVSHQPVNCARVVICRHTLTGPPVLGQPLLTLTGLPPVRRFPWTVGPDNLIVRVARGCARGVAVSLRPRGRFRVRARVLGSRGGTIALVLRAVRPGSAVLATSRGARVVERVRLIALPAG
jgi:hypothetical protein